MAFHARPLLLVGICLLFPSATLAQQYTLTVRSDHPYYDPRAINAAGQVVGSWGTYRAFLWSDGMVQDLGPLPGTDSCRAFAINDGGQVVGSCVAFGGGGAYQSFLWTADTGMTALPVPGWSGAMGINNQGHIVGWRSEPTSGAPADAFLYRNGVVEDLGLGHALGINDQDQVVGFRDGESAGITVARLWDAAGPHDLDNEGGSSVAYAVSAEGLIAGSSTRGWTPNGFPMHAVLWTPYGISDLGTLGGSQSWAFGINGGLVVGGADLASGGAHAFLYDINGPGHAVDLNDLIPPSGHRLYSATAINAAGQIIGSADCCGESEFFVLTPITPTPPR
jgi:probable HAF family extracellular repeat protein